MASENGGNRLQIFDFEGNFVRIVGAGQFSSTYHLFVDSDDNILVADTGNNRIQVFHQNGNHIKTIGTGHLSHPGGVCLDREGRIIVSEVGSQQSVRLLGSFALQNNLLFLWQRKTLISFFLSLSLEYYSVDSEKERKEEKQNRNVRCVSSCSFPRSSFPSLLCRALSSPTHHVSKPL